VDDSTEQLGPLSGETEPLVLSSGDAFCILNRRGDIAPVAACDLGLFHEDTRHLSRYELVLQGGPPVLLSADTAAAASSQIDLALTDRSFGGALDHPQNFLHIRRKQLLDGEFVEQLVLTNHLRHAIDLWIELHFAVDFADMFEVRGVRRSRRGESSAPLIESDRVSFSYLGLDGLRYGTRVHFAPRPNRLGAGSVNYRLALASGESTVIQAIVEPEREPERGHPKKRPMRAFHERLAVRQQVHERFLSTVARVKTSHMGFDLALSTSLEDISALRLQIDEQSIVGAGIPWFAAPFGRDALVTSLELLSVAPDLAKDTLRALAHFQGRRTSDFTEEEPGKILHELRRGEMVRTGEIPHSPYYGSIDATPLWLILLGETHRWLGDGALLSELWPHAKRALAWLSQRLDDGHGLIRYYASHGRGLKNQGWKDSQDGVSFPDGTPAEPPIALVEVQGYAVAALVTMARLCRLRGETEEAERLTARAIALRRLIKKRFWVQKTRYFALAIDGDERPVPTVTSNPGHLLFCDAVTRSRAHRIVDLLLSDGLFSGWGVRTVARGQAVYNPLSYHNGSVWPHDNALIGYGAALAGRTDATLRIIESLFDSASHFSHRRLPELFCGLGRGAGEFLVRYPVSCSPQAWASGALFLLLQACLGLRPDASRQVLQIVRPELPVFVDALELHRMRIGEGRISLRFSRQNGRTHVDLLGVSPEPTIRVQIELG
jgi:glycogen debranching enzyme